MRRAAAYKDGLVGTYDPNVRTLFDVFKYDRSSFSACVVSSFACSNTVKQFPDKPCLGTRKPLEGGKFGV